MSRVVLGTDAETGQEVWIDDVARHSGLYMLGKPGMGKSAAAVNIALQDITNNHGICFIDPHGDAVIDLSRRLKSENLSATYLLDPEDDTHSFGINLLKCRNVESLRERTATYTRAYNVFYKLWEDQWGPWLQLILQNVLWVFIENQSYTLAEAPLFLNPRNTAFREHIIDNIKYNDAVADFWRYEFFDSKRREQEQQARVDAALTRLNTLLTHPYVRHIIGQRTTLDFEKIVSGTFAVLFRLSANLAPDIKKFIGTMLMSELLHAVRARREGARDQFCLFIDEFANFASNDDMATMVTEGRKFGLASTYMHVERFGQLGDNQKLMGATQATVNKIAFQLTVKDAEELAPEYAKTVEPTEKRREPELIISPHPMEDIWRNGHPNANIMRIRKDYFRFVELLQANPQEKYFAFDPANPRDVHKEFDTREYASMFNDWGLYRSSAEMIREGITLLNEFFYRGMQGSDLKRTIAGNELELLMRIIECFGGVLAFRPSMIPYLTQEVRKRMDHVFSRNLIDILQHSYSSASGYVDRSLNPLIRAQLEERTLAHRQQNLKEIHQLQQFGTGIEIPDLLHPKDISMLQQFWLGRGMSLREIEDMISWRPLPVEADEIKYFREYIRAFVNMEEDNMSKARDDYAWFMALHATSLKFAPDTHIQDPPARKYFELCLRRGLWQTYETGVFIAYCFGIGENTLQREPVKTASNRYEETLRVERPQHDLVTDMELELSRLPRFRAYAKIAQEKDDRQTVQTHKIQTNPLPKIEDSQGEIKAIDNAHPSCKERDQIEEEIRARQSPWRDGGQSPPTTREQR